MPRSLPSKNCIHPEDMVYTFGDGLGNFKTQCGLCMLGGEWCKNTIVARVSFLEKTINQKEKTVSTTDYKQLPGDMAYRKGVEDATKPLNVGEHMSLGSSVGRSAPTEKILADRRKYLLTRKVTKYFFLYKPGDRVSSLYDTEELARQMSLNNLGETAENVLGGVSSVTYEESI
jgi:hypothetical protein